MERKMVVKSEVKLKRDFYSFQGKVNRLNELKREIYSIENKGRD